jgi:hypothetical protein
MRNVGSEAVVRALCFLARPARASALPRSGFVQAWICGVTEYAQQYERQALGGGTGSATALHIRLARE